MIDQWPDEEDFIDGLVGLELMYPNLERDKPQQRIFKDLIFEVDGLKYKVRAEQIQET